MRKIEQSLKGVGALTLILLTAASCSSDTDGPADAPSSSAGAASDRPRAIAAIEDSAAQKLAPFEAKLAQIGYHSFVLHVGPAGSSGSDVRVDAFELAWSPASIIYAGRDPANTGSSDPNDRSRRVSSVFEASKRFPKSLLVSAGLSATEANTPFGLLMVEQRFYTPFNFGRQNGRIRYSGVLCIDPNGQIFIYDSERYLNDPSRVSTDCFSALQAFPIVVDYSRSVIDRSEMATTPLPRVVVGIDKRKRRFVLVFRDPINLYAVAQFLTQSEDSRPTISVEEPP